MDETVDDIWFRDSGMGASAVDVDRARDEIYDARDEGIFADQPELNDDHDECERHQEGNDSLLR
jgi:hypothetical protein